MTPRLLVPFALLATPLSAQVAPSPAAVAPSDEASSPTPEPTLAPTTAPTTAVPPPVIATLPVATPTPEPRATPTRRATPTPTPRASPTPTPTPIPTPTFAPTSVAPPAAMVAGRPAEALPRTEASEPLWALPVSGGLLAGLVLMAFVIRRRRRHALAGEGEDMPVAEPDAPETPVAVDAPPPATAAPAHPVARAGLSFFLRPRRAGVNLLTATLDAEIVVRNDGDAPADRVRVDLRLLSARGGQEEELAAVFADDSVRPAAPPFTLAPGEERSVSALATLARHDINVVTAGDRPMFVPVAAVSVRYRDGDRAAQVAQAFALGVERDGAEKLGPFWLDAPSRMHDAIGARVYAPEVRR